MARPYKYSDEDVLQAATCVFWEHGYAATSMKMLEHATGLGAGSLYNRYHDKENLFALCLNHFIDGAFSRRLQRLQEAPNALEGLRSYLSALLKSAGTRQSDGCFLLNAHYEAFQFSPLLRDIIEKAQRRSDDAVLATLRRARAEGQLRAGMQPEIVARQVSLIVSGFLARSRLRSRQSENDASLAALLKLLQ